MEIPEEIKSAAESARSKSLIPEKSKTLYNKTYQEFVNWCDSKKVKNYKSEDVLLAYFSHLSEERKPSSLWSYYSMLKATIKMHHYEDIGRYSALFAFLKRNSEGFKPKKAKILNREQIETFLREAPEDTYLMIKVSLIFGIAGALRRQELTQLEVDDIQDTGSSLLVTVRETKDKIDRVCSVIDNAKESPSYLDIFKKYSSLRPVNTQHRRFFLCYNNGKCSRQMVGKNTFGAMPSKIATYLKLPNPELYTGHSFRRSSATLLADSGEGIINIKRHGGWKSSAVAESYIENSEENKLKIAKKVLVGEEIPQKNLISNNQLPKPSTSHDQSCQDNQQDIFEQGCERIGYNHKYPGISMSNCNNCIVNINYSK